MLRKTLRESGRARMANTLAGGRSIFAASRMVQKKPSFACVKTHEIADFNRLRRVLMTYPTDIARDADMDTTVDIVNITRSAHAPSNLRPVSRIQCFGSNQHGDVRCCLDRGTALSACASRHVHANNAQESVLAYPVA